EREPGRGHTPQRRRAARQQHHQRVVDRKRACPCERLASRRQRALVGHRVSRLDHLEAGQSGAVAALGRELPTRDLRPHPLQEAARHRDRGLAGSQKVKRRRRQRVGRARSRVHERAPFARGHRLAEHLLEHTALQRYRATAALRDRAASSSTWFSRAIASRNRSRGKAVKHMRAYSANPSPKASPGASRTPASTSRSRTGTQSDAPGGTYSRRSRNRYDAPWGAKKGARTVATACSRAARCSSRACAMKPSAWASARTAPRCRCSGTLYTV